MTNTMPRGSESVEPPASVTSPGVWQHALRIPSQDQTDSITRGILPSYNLLVDGILGGFNVICVYYRLVIGRQHGQVLEPQDVPQIYRPPVQPKPKVALRAQGDPHIVTPDNYGDGNNAGAAGDNLKFSSLKGIQSGFAKKRVDLFEAL